MSIGNENGVVWCSLPIEAENNWHGYYVIDGREKWCGHEHTDEAAADECARALAADTSADSENDVAYRLKEMRKSLDLTVKAISEAAAAEAQSFRAQIRELRAENQQLRNRVTIHNDPSELGWG